MNQGSITPEQALKLIKPLKPEEFIEMTYTDGISRCCVMGHLTRLTSDNPSDYSDRNCDAQLSNRVGTLRKIATRNTGSLDRINNGNVSAYQQKTIKGRVTAALKDIIKLEKS